MERISTKPHLPAIVCAASEKRPIPQSPTPLTTPPFPAPPDLYERSGGTLYIIEMKRIERGAIVVKYGVRLSSRLSVPNDKIMMCLCLAGNAKPRVSSNWACANYYLLLDSLPSHGFCIQETASG